MDISEVRARKAELEVELSNLINEKLTAFQEETGIEGVQLELIGLEITSYSSKTPRFIHHVKIKVEI